MTQFKKVTSMSNFKLGKNAEEQMKTKDIKEVQTDGTSVECGAGVTISRNYNSIRVDCHVRYPTVRGEEKKAAKEAWEFVADELDEQLIEADKLLRKLK